MTSSVLPVAASAVQISPSPVQAGWGVSLTDLSAFNEALARAGQPLQAQHTQASSETMKALFRPLEQINTEASTLSQHARAAMQAGSDLTPGEMVMLTVRCQEFLFHSQLTANVANRTSDGLQQLFRQQA
ncbi:hypothetical protein CKO44_12855 [Rubrivivax gelatinosus]|uniref:Flagellar hook-basal body complex protein FliE n=1 Tax=Rubrivivax gelatinosus TaxID=28068 RepID=A0ABS1DZY6_RUBGE|nr:hypothetical protein [Rubrivivax gelatinosus]MBK1614357.1 hypothetical protein [Rubrivivax gelatinosus]MBK1714197.1 hypothetical protein [Rubrivivax gelatinosus]